jgi:hypothetical protein
MVHALEEVHRLLKPDGYLIEIHPIPEVPLVNVFEGNTALFAGPYPGYDYEEDLRQAENTIQQIVQRGLFVIERISEFDFLTYGSSITELQDFWGEPAGAREAELYTQVEEMVHAAGKGVRVALHEKARITRLSPMSDR